MIFKGLAVILCTAAIAVSFPGATAYAANGADDSLVTGIVTTIPNLETSVPQTSQTQAESQTIDETEATTTALPYEEPVYDDDNDRESLLDQLGINQSSTTLDLILLLTIFSLAPSILVLLTCFTRIIISFSLLRNAMGVQQTPPNQVMIGLALFLTLFIMTPVLNEMNDVAYVPYKEGQYTSVEAVQAASVPLKQWMLKNTSNDSMDFFLGLTGTEIIAETEEEFLEEVSFVVVVPAFVLSEIKIGFEIGFLIYIPFLIIDIVVSTLLMSMGMMMLPPTTVSVPFKILLFILADGWTLLIGSLVSGFNH
ncbi:MAG: flagellar type III secretion system pore protein FliP [Oscillospiraceae bacterium]|nr:flagellar type III secretion system pore protein FliP [Oscillospiraceae bacterium]